jgi:hypothetical protein
MYASRWWFLVILSCFIVQGAHAATFKVGYAERDITPKDPIPMWGYGARHDLPATGTLDPLFAKAVVIETDNGKLALMGLDLGRGPTQRMMEYIEERAKREAGVEFLLISGSHTHHGPVIELVDEPGKGRGKFDAAVKYADDLMHALGDVIVEAAQNTQPAKIGWGSENTDLNRNRHTKKIPKPVDPELTVIRFDTLDDKPIALMVNFAAHAVIADILDRRWTSEWPGHMQHHVEQTLSTHCFFMQGAAGDMSPNTNAERQGIDGFGKAVAQKVLEINARIQTKVPEHPSVQGKYDTFAFKTRVDLHHPLVQATYGQMFFPEMLAMLNEIPADTIYPRLVTVLLNGELALVGGSGEFFCEHANRLKRESPAPKTVFVGYCNGHHMYFPTLAAIEEGGYGADPAVSWVEPGAGEKMIDRALENIREMLASSR